MELFRTTVWFYYYLYHQMNRYSSFYSVWEPLTVM